MSSVISYYKSVPLTMMNWRENRARLRLEITLIQNRVLNELLTEMKQVYEEARDDGKVVEIRFSPEEIKKTVLEQTKKVCE